MGTTPKIALAAPHYWEEPCISGKNGSGTVFFSGCTMKCVFCQNYEISSMGQGKYVTAYELSEIYRSLEDKGVHNINLVTATHFIDEIIKSFEIYMPKIPIVYNCGGYEKVETIKRIEGIVSVYLPDFKYGFDELGEKYSKAVNYVETAENAIGEMVRQRGKVQFDENGMITSGVIVRHLILPNPFNIRKFSSRSISPVYHYHNLGQILFQHLHQCIFHITGNLSRLLIHTP